jgi:sugar/nucleoside kinase (ribokinase family)
MAGRVVALGNVIVDHVFALPRPLVPDGKIMAQRYAAFAGGQAANTAVAMAILGLEVRFLGAFGDDAGAELSRRAFAARGIDLAHSQTHTDCAQQTAVVLVHGAERTIAIHRDARLTFDPDRIGPETLAGCALAYTDGHEGPASLQLGALARRAGLPLVIDLEHAGPGERALAELATHLVAPGQVIRALAGTDNLAEALRRLRGNGERCVVATLGAEGSLGLDLADDAPTACPARPCEVIDTTGAGDAYHAGYVRALLDGGPLAQRMDFATRIAAAKVSTAGPQIVDLPPLDQAPEG